MSEAVLSTLCGICHAQPPKYKCPRCGARTCSLPCTQKHKARAECDGVRNPRAFVPIDQLRTPAGIDHDFNFISSIERARQRAEKDLVEVRCLLSEKEVRAKDPKDDEKQFRKVWYGDELHHVPVSSKSAGGSGGGDVGVDGFDKHVRRRLRQLDIEAVTMPKGMARQRENATAWNRRTLSINWQVEWLVFGATGLAAGSQESLQHPVRILRKILEGKPLNEALVSTLGWYRGQLDRQSREQGDNDESEAEEEEHPRKRKKNRGRKKPQVSAVQNPTSTAWPSGIYTIQSPVNGEWNQSSSSSSVPKAADEDAAIFAKWQFFLLQAQKPSKTKIAKALIPISPIGTLATALSGRTVVEFPTIYALPPGQSLPEGFAAGPVERQKRNIDGVMEDDTQAASRPPRKKPAFEHHQNQTRGKWDGPRGGRGRGGRGARGERNVQFEQRSDVPEALEEGEINSDGDEMEVDKIDDDYDNARPFNTYGMVSVESKVGTAMKPAGGLVDYDSSGGSE